MAEVVDFSEYAQTRKQETSIVGEVSLSEQSRRELLWFLEQQIQLAIGERGQFINNLKRWQFAYNAPPATEPKDFPVKNASNLTIPIIKEVVNTMVAQLTQTTLTPTPQWSMQAIADEWEPFVPTIERFMDIAAKRELKIGEKAETWILEGTKYGTSILQIGYREDVRTHYLYNRDGIKPQKVKNVKQCGPVIFNVPLEDFMIPFTSTNIQDARWCGKRFRRNKKQLMHDVKRGYYKKKDIEKLINFDSPLNETDNDQNNEVQELHEEMQAAEPRERDTFELYEIYLGFDLGDEEMAELIVHYHLRTGTLLRVNYNQFWHMKRPFIKFAFFPVEHRFYAQGLCEMLEALQDEVSEMHNQRIDSTTITNTRPLLVTRTSKSLKPGDPLFSGQIIPVDSPTDVTPLQLGAISPSTIVNEGITRDIIERLSGVTEANSRGGQPVTRTTATAQIALLQEQAKRFDQTVRSIRNGLSEAGDMIFSLYFQFGVDEKRVVQWLGERGRIMVGIFNLPLSAVEHGLGFRSASPTSAQNKELQRQNAIQIWQLSLQMYTQIIDFIERVGIPPEQLAPVAIAFVQSSEKFMQSVLDRFDVTNPDDITAGLRVLERILPAPEDFGGSKDFEAASQRAKEAEQLARLEAVLSPPSGNEAELANVGSEDSINP